MQINFDCKCVYVKKCFNEKLSSAFISQTSVEKNYKKLCGHDVESIQYYIYCSCMTNIVESPSYISLNLHYGI